MMTRGECPECGSRDTERVHTEWMSDMVEEVRVCNDCPTQYTNQYDLFDQRKDEVPA
jgi:protein-arginine kinase activator protein McsA